MSASVSPPNRYFILAVLCTASFVVLFSNIVIIPILKEVSDEFGVSVGLGGLLATSYALIAAIGSPAGVMTSVPTSFGASAAVAPGVAPTASR